LVKGNDSLRSIKIPKIVFRRAQTISNNLVSSLYPPKRWSFQNTFPKPTKAATPLFPTPLNNISRTNTLHNYMPITTVPLMVNQCGQANCGTCPCIQPCSVICGTTSQTRHPIEQPISCQSKNLIYLFTCSVCRLHYSGETGCSLRKRFTDHCSCIRLHKKSPRSKLTPIGIHFNSPSHYISS